MGIKTVLSTAQFFGQVRLSVLITTWSDAFQSCVISSQRHWLAPFPATLQGFAERKVILVSDTIAACKKIHNDEVRKERLAALASNKRQVSGLGLD